LPVKNRLKPLIDRLETRTLLALFCLVGALWAFLFLAGEVSEGETSTLDKLLIMMLRVNGNETAPIGSLWFQDAMRDVTALGSFPFLVMLTIAATLGLILHDKWREGAILVVTALCSQASIEILKAFYNRPRPDNMLHGVHVFSPSFPSGHSAESTAIFLTLASLIAMLERKTAAKVLPYAVAIITIAGVGFSRVYLGVHWPTDVLGGWVLGTGWALLGWLFLQRPHANKT
jgi:undecaprenyl-diphosphatase